MFFFFCGQTDWPKTIYSAKIKSTHFIIPNIVFYYRFNTHLANLRCTHNRWFMCRPHFTRSKQCDPQKKKKKISFARALCAAHIHIRCQYRTS